MKGRFYRVGRKIVPIILMLGLSIPLHASAESELNFVEGNGQKVELGDGLAELTLNSGYSFLNGEDTRSYETQNGGVPNDREIGAVLPDSDDERWMVYFDYEDVGHVSDDDKDSIDADDLLQSYKEGTEESNKKLDESKHLFVDGWESPPHYDERIHSLTWSLLLHRSDQSKLINYNIRVLTREGYISAILVSAPEDLDASREKMEKDVLGGFAVKEGKRYEDFNASTDKKSKYGLAALVVGGAGIVVAKKVGLIALILLGAKKFGIVLVALIAGLWRWLRGKSSKPAHDASLQEAAASREEGPPYSGSGASTQVQGAQPESPVEPEDKLSPPSK